MTTKIAYLKPESRPNAPLKTRTRRRLALAGAGLAACLGATWGGMALLARSDDLSNKSKVVAQAAAGTQKERPETPNRAAAEPARTLASAEVSDEAKPIAAADFTKLREMIKPRKGEASWEEIPWMTNLWEARKKAAKEGKPLFVWSASADAQGCT